MGFGGWIGADGGSFWVEDGGEDGDGGGELMELGVEVRGLHAAFVYLRFDRILFHHVTDGNCPPAYGSRAAVPALPSARVLSAAI